MAASSFERVTEEEVVISDSKKVVIMLDRNTKNNKMFLGLREYITSDSYTGFTQKGVNIPVTSQSDLSNLGDIIKKIAEKFPAVEETP